MSQVPENFAPGSIESFAVFTSPEMSEEAFNDNNSVTFT